MSGAKVYVKIFILTVCCLKMSLQNEFNVHDLKVRSLLEDLSNHNDSSTKLRELITRAVAESESDLKLRVKSGDLSDELKKTILLELDLLEDKGKSFFGAFEEGLEKLACNFGVTRFCGGTTNNNSTSPTSTDDNEPSIDLPSTSTLKPEGTGDGSDKHKANETLAPSHSASEDDFDDGEGTLIDSPTTTTEETMDVLNSSQPLETNKTTTANTSGTNGNGTIVEPIEPVTTEESLHALQLQETVEQQPDEQTFQTEAPTTTTEKQIVSSTTSNPIVEEIVTDAPTTTTEKQLIPSTLNQAIGKANGTTTEVSLAPETTESQEQTTTSSTKALGLVDADQLDVGEGILSDVEVLNQGPQANLTKMTDDNSSEGSNENNSGESEEKIPVGSPTSTLGPITNQNDQSQNSGSEESKEEDATDTGSLASTPPSSTSEPDSSEESTTPLPKA